jgi:hypothetical protein
MTIAAALSVACSSSTTATRGPGESTNAPLMTTTNEEGLVVEKASLAGTGKIDVWTYFRVVEEKNGAKARVLVRKTIDLNADGKPDVSQFYDDRGTLVKEQTDHDFDGRADTVKLFKNGKIDSEEASSLFDGKFDIRKYFEDGVLVVKQVDTRRVGAFDEFQYYKGSKLYRIGWDRDGDGKPEVFDENPAMSE